MGIGNEDIAESYPEQILADARFALLDEINLCIDDLEESKISVESSEVGLAEARRKLAVFDKWVCDHGMAPPQEAF